jgi:hypothetical protein
MPKTIPVIFGADTSIRYEQRKAYTDFVNELLADMKEEILSDVGYIKVISENRVIKNSTYTSFNTELKNKVDSKLSSSPFQY